MALPSSYFVVQNKISNIMKSLQKAGVPEKFTLSFLESLGYKSTNDRPIIAMLKSLGFLDQNGIPTDVYRAYKNTNNSETILGQKLKETYKEIFLADEKAQDLGVEKLKGIFASVTGKGDSVALKMAQTFKSFCSISNLEDINSINIEEEKVKEAIKAEGCNTASDAVEAISTKVTAMVKEAAERAKANGRKTVRGVDF